MREYIIRQLFIKADIISKEDHDDRLLFFTHLEATFYYLQRLGKNMDIKLYEEDRESILCRVSSNKEGNLSLHLDIIKLRKLTFNFREEFFQPESIRSDFVSLSLLGLKEDIRNIIKSTISVESDTSLDLMIKHALDYFSEKTVNLHTHTYA